MDKISVTKLLIAFEPPHDKTNKVTVHPAKTQISLGIHPVWSESSLCIYWVAKDPSFLHADIEDSDQTGHPSDLSLCWAHSHFVGFVMRWLIWFCLKGLELISLLQQYFSEVIVCCSLITICKWLLAQWFPNRPVSIEQVPVDWL